MVRRLHRETAAAIRMVLSDSRRVGHRTERDTPDPDPNKAE